MTSANCTAITLAACEEPETTIKMVTEIEVLGGGSTPRAVVEETLVRARVAVVAVVVVLVVIEVAVVVLVVVAAKVVAAGVVAVFEVPRLGPVAADVSMVEDATCTCEVVGPSEVAVTVFVVGDELIVTDVH